MVQVERLPRFPCGQCALRYSVIGSRVVGEDDGGLDVGDGGLDEVSDGWELDVGDGVGEASDGCGSDGEADDEVDGNEADGNGEVVADDSGVGVGPLVAPVAGATEIRVTDNAAVMARRILLMTASRSAGGVEGVGAIVEGAADVR
jgi:hypothetical protein